MDKTISDLELVTKIQLEKCDNSLKELISRHTPLCLSMFRKYAAFFSENNDGFNDLISDKDYLIYVAASTFNPTKKTKFSTWLANYARYFCLNSLNSKKNLFDPTENKELYSKVDAVIGQEPDKDNTEFIFHILDNLKDKRISKIFKFRYFDGNFSWQKIAKKICVSTQTAINLHNEGKRILVNKLKSEECFDVT